MDIVTKLQKDYKYFEDLLKRLEKGKKDAWSRFCKNEVQRKTCRDRCNV